MSDGPGLAYLILALVTVQRVAELWLARRNTARLLAAGGEEHGAGQHPFFILLHGGWLVALAVSISPATPINWPLLTLFAALQVGRVWVIASLGRYWTTRIVTVPGAPLVRRGPYKWVRHPNYLVVALELPVLPLSFGLWQIAAVFGVLNLALLAWRIRAEDGVLQSRR